MRINLPRLSVVSFCLTTVLLLVGIVVFGQTSTQTFTPGANQTFTVPAGVTSVTIQAWGAGGGTGASSTTKGGGGGGGGGYTERTIAVTAGDVINITVGAGAVGAAGGNTTVSHAASGTNMAANGGGAGGDNAGAAGTASGGTTNSSGGSGGAGGASVGTKANNFSGGGGGGGGQAGCAAGIGQSGGDGTAGVSGTPGTGGYAGGSNAFATRPCGSVNSGTIGSNGSQVGVSSGNVGGGAGGFGGFLNGNNTKVSGGPGQVIISWSCPAVDVSNFSTSAPTPVCSSSVTVTLSSSTVPNGTYTVTYNLTGANTATGQTAFVSFASNTGTFNVSLSSTGSTTITITKINCTTVSSSNTAVVSYTSGVSITTASPWTASGVCFSATSDQASTLAYSGTSGSPNQYSIAWSSTLADVTNAALSSSPISILVPANTPAGTYTGAFTVRNSSTGCVSAAKTFTLTVNPAPNDYTLSVSGGGTNFCAKVNPVILSLSGSQSGVTYVLQGTNPPGSNEAAQAYSLPGTGSALSWSIPAKHKFSYNVTATNNTTGCTAVMTGTITATLPATVTPTPPTSVSVCPGYDAQISLTANYATSAQWEISTNGGSTWNNLSANSTYSISTNIAGDFATSTTILTINNATNSLNNNQYRVVFGSSSPCTSTTSTPATTLLVGSGTSTTWTAAEAIASNKTKWEYADNWSCGVPTSSTDAIIPIDIIDGYPKIAAGITGSVKNLTIQSGGALPPYVTVLGTLQVAGTITNANQLDITAGTIEFNGTATQTIAAGTFLDNTVKNLKLSNSVNLGGTLDLTGTLSFGAVSSKTFATGGYLTLKSDNTATARVADLTNSNANSGNTISGAVTVERSINSAYTRRWRLVTAPVTGTSINAAWQEGRTWNGSSTDNASPGFGTLITGNGATYTSASAANAKGFDWWSALSSVSTASVRTYQGALSNLIANWAELTSTTAGSAFDNHQAYLLFIRGDRSVSTGNGSTTLRAKGVLKEAASYSVSVPSTQLHTLIGNPFASPINFNSISTENSNKIMDYFWIWKSSLNATGGYTLVKPSGGGSYEYIPYQLTAGNSSVGSPIIASGEGFFVEPKNGGGTITIRQTHKSTGNPPVSTLRQQVPMPARLYVNVYGDVDGTETLMDGALAEFGAAFAAESHDVLKALNSNENLSVWKTGKDMIVTQAGLPHNRDIVQLRLWNTKEKQYRIDVRSQDFSSHGMVAFLVDKFLGKETPISLADAVTPYAFTISGEPASQDPLRFSIVFRAGASSPPPMVTRIDAQEKNGSVQITWQVEEEDGIQAYNLEKSLNGSSFKVFSVARPRAGNGQQSYESVDVNPAAVNFYRIQLVGKVGEVKYSNVVKLELQGISEGVRVFPNPMVVGENLQVQMLRKPVGTYMLTLYNSNGQRVMQQQIQHQGGSNTHSLPQASALARGTYTLEVKPANGKKETVKLHLVK